MADLRLRVLTLEREVLDSTVQQVTAEGSLGQFGILPLHITFLTSLEPGLLTVHSGSSRETLLVKSGYAEMRDDVITILADEAVRPNEVDPAAASERLEKATAALEEAPFGTTGHEAARRELRWAAVLQGHSASPN